MAAKDKFLHMGLVVDTSSCLRFSVAYLQHKPDRAWDVLLCAVPVLGHGGCSEANKRTIQLVLAHI